MKKAKKKIENMVGISIMGSAGSIALGALGGAPATHGQQGIARATSFLPTVGTMAGIEMMFDAMKPLTKKRKRR